MKKDSSGTSHAISKNTAEVVVVLHLAGDTGQDVNVSVCTWDVLSNVRLLLHLLRIVLPHRAHGLHRSVRRRMRARVCVARRCDTIDYDGARHSEGRVDAFRTVLFHLLHRVAPNGTGARARVTLQDWGSHPDLLCLDKINLAVLHGRHEMLGRDVHLAAARRQSQVLTNVCWLTVQPADNLRPLHLASWADYTNCISDCNVTHGLWALRGQGRGACWEAEPAHCW